MRLPRLRDLVDERFLEHRRRSTSAAGIVACVLALALFLYHDLVQHVLSWELLAVGLAFVVVKYVVFAWYRMKD